MSRSPALIYGLVVYALFLGTFLYAIGFISGVFVPRTIDTELTTTPLATAILINVGLLAVFAIQHTIMARTTFKRWWTRIIHPAVERSTFVLVTCIIMITMFWQWRAIPVEIWNVDALWARTLLWSGCAFGWAMALYSTMLIDHFDLFGLRQVWLHFRGRQYTDHPFSERSLYRIVRHPLMLGFMIAFWCTPTMTAGHLLFNVVVTAYVLVAIRIEEATLIGHLGDAYRQYRKKVPALLPIPRPAGSVDHSTLPVASAPQS